MITTGYWSVTPTGLNDSTSSTNEINTTDFISTHKDNFTIYNTHEGLNGEVTLIEEK